MHYKLFDASYHNYRMIDRDRADATEYQKVKSTFDYVNDLLGNNQNIPSEQLVSAYQQLEKALELARTLPQQSTTEKRGRRSTRSVVENRSSRSDYLDARTEYYVSKDDDDSGFLLVLSSMLQIEDGLIIYQDLGTSYVLLMYKVMLISLQNDLKMDINGIFYLIVIIKGMNICTIGLDFQVIKHQLVQ